MQSDEGMLCGAIHRGISYQFNVKFVTLQIALSVEGCIEEAQEVGGREERKARLQESSAWEPGKRGTHIVV